MDISYVFAMAFKCIQVFQTYVASVSDICCRCFYLDVANVDRDIIHVAMGTHLLLMHVTAAGAPLWVTVRRPKAGRCLRGVHPQEGQVIGTHVDFPCVGATAIGQNRASAMVEAGSSVGSMWWGARKQVGAGSRNMRGSIRTLATWMAFRALASLFFILEDRKNM
jgi:hypothetical protein